MLRHFRCLYLFRCLLEYSINVCQIYFSQNFLSSCKDNCYCYTVDILSTFNFYYFAYIIMETVSPTIKCSCINDFNNTNKSDAQARQMTKF